KAVLERAFRNYYYYKYVPGYGGYSYYTTCMIDINAGGQITYNDLYPAEYDPTKSYVVSLEFNGQEVNFTDADTYYRVSTVNYLAAGSCNFNDSGVSLWPLDQITDDTQFYVRDAVIHYIQAQTEPINPQIEGRLVFIKDATPPTITINSPTATSYLHPEFLTIDFTVEDLPGTEETDVSGLASVTADLDGMEVMDGDVIDLYTLSLGEHTLTVYAVDKAGNEATASVTFTIIANAESLEMAVWRFYNEGEIDNEGVRDSLLAKIEAIQAAIERGGHPIPSLKVLKAFINEVMAQSGKHITEEAAYLLIMDAKYIFDPIYGSATKLPGSLTADLLPPWFYLPLVRH
ncbi:MAG: Ig domain protein group 2 domain protein, partial [Chloroflexi bacterium]|nr:Ig domain protein group 2 domain protein [Chloroflexota bacterium]